MTIETMIRRGFDRPHVGLAGLDTRKLKAMRNSALRACFNRIDETCYRLEYVASIRGREYINDAAARTVNATWYSLESVHGGLVWITCASEAEQDYARLIPLAMRKVRLMLVIGDATQLKKSFGPAVPQIKECNDMHEAVHQAYLYDAEDVKVLFSPACTNDMTTEMLGEAFRHEVNEL